MIVVITGASKGLGKAIAEVFAKDGHTILVCARSEVQLYNMMQELLNKYPQCTIKARPVDMAIKYEVTSFAQWCLQYGNPDILVNNAGQFIPGSVITEADGQLEQLMAINLYSAYYLTRALLPAMQQQKGGHIFNMCSIASLKAYENGGSYSITKFALAGFSKNLREELKNTGIKVTGIYPGAAYTDSWSGSDVNPNRIMEAADVAAMVYAAAQLSPQACVEDIILRPQLGDL